MDWWDDLSPSTPDDDPVAPGVEEPESAPAIEDEGMARDDEPAVELPPAGTAELILGSRGQARQAGDLPLAVTPESAAGRGETVQVEVLDQEVAARAGVKGFAFRVSGEDGHELAPPRGQELPATVEIDYSSFEDLYGAGYGDRLRVVALPDCALADPVPDDCDRFGAPVPTKNDHGEHRLTVDLPDLADPAPEPGGRRAESTGPGSAVLAVTAGPEGEGGSFKATPLAVSGDWDVGIGSGEFSWSYDLPVPDAPAGPTPQISLGYSSGAIDGMVSSRNTQGGAMGTGWSDFASNFVERRYGSCLDDGQTTYADLCWKKDNAVISLNGHASELVALPGSTTEYRLKFDPRWKVDRLTGASNGDDNGEHWRVTTPEGTRYFFGLGSSPDKGTATESVWTVPVVGDDAGEPCNTAPSNMCTQAWRWNLDRVVDPHGNVQTWQYRQESNKYHSLKTDGDKEYVLGGQLDTVWYGERAGSPSDGRIKVVFSSWWRCSTLQTDEDATPCGGPGSGANFPDAPMDLYCEAGCTEPQPTFFTKRRYYKVETFVQVGADRELVDTIRFTHQFSDPDPSTTDDTKLWLSAIQRTGNHPDTGASLTLPPETFTPVAKNNRFNPGAGESAMPHWRIGSVKDEFGRRVDVTYDRPHPCALPPDPSQPWFDLNTNDCFPSLWAPEGQTPTFRLFHKYLVTQVQVVDTTGGSPTMTTTYAYGNQLGTGLPNAAWHHDDNDFVPEANKTWSEWRGYQDVRVTQGTTSTRYKLFTGMKDDQVDPTHFPGGLRPSTISSLDGTVTNTSNDDWLAGHVLDELSLRGDGTGERGTVHAYTAVRTVDAPGTNPLDDAHWVAETSKVERRRTPAAGQVFSRRQTQTTYNGLLLFPEQVVEQGWTDQSGDERCTKTTYAINSPAWMLDYPSTVTRYANATCTGTEVTRSETAYDGGAFGAGPTYPGGNQTGTRTKLTAAPTWATTTSTFDPLGRPEVVTDPNGHTTTTSYDPEVGPPETVTVSNHLGQTNTTHMMTVWQVPEDTVDANDKTTTYAYDALGRITEVRQPTEATGPNPSWTFSYDVDPERDEVPVVRTRQLQDTNGSSGAARYLDTWAVYDSLLRERQTQRVSPASTSSQAKTIVTSTVYDDRGLVHDKSLPQAVNGTPGVGLLPTPSGGWANVSTTVYDTIARPTWELTTNSDGLYRQQTTTYTDKAAEMTPLTPGGAPAGTKTLTVKDAYDRTTRVEEHDGTAYRPTVYTYDAADRLTTVTDPAANVTTYGYDMAGRRTSMLDADTGKDLGGAGHWSYGYDAGGNQTSITDAKGATVTTLYDALDRPLQRRQGSATGPVLASWSYDAPGELGLLDKTTRATPSGNFVVDVNGYDARNRPTGRTWTVPAAITGLSGSYQVGYLYDAADHMTSTIYPAAGGLALEWVVTNYNSIGQPETMTSNLGSYVYTAAYDDRGRALLFGFGSSSAPALGKLWGYDNNQRLASTQVAAGGGAAVQSRTLGYDLAGDITQRDSSLTTGLGMATTRECFGYDQRLRLTAAYTTTTATTCASGTNKGTGPAPYSHTYTYTHDGNLDARTEGATTIDYTYPASGASSVRPHAPTAVGSSTYQWDANGSLDARTVAGQTEDLVWDVEHRLASIDDPDGDSSFVYDAEGTRLLRQSPAGSTLFIEGMEITKPTSGSTTAVRSIGFGDRTIATRSSSGVDYVVSDNLGSIEMSVPAGASTADVARTYLPYGKVRSGGQLDSDRGWIGQVEDDASALQYLNARYYDPSVGVFLSADPAADPSRPKTLNPYSYAAGNPTSSTDPLGLDPPCFHGGGVTCGGDEKAGQVAAVSQASGGDANAAYQSVQTAVLQDMAATGMSVQDFRNLSKLLTDLAAMGLGPANLDEHWQEVVRRRQQIARYPVDQIMRAGREIMFQQDLAIGACGELSVQWGKFGVSSQGCWLMAEETVGFLQTIGGAVVTGEGRRASASVGPIFSNAPRLSDIAGDSVCIGGSAGAGLGGGMTVCASLNGDHEWNGYVTVVPTVNVQGGAGAGVSYGNTRIREWRTPGWLRTLVPNTPDLPEYECACPHSQQSLSQQNL